MSESELLRKARVILAEVLGVQVREIEPSCDLVADLGMNAAQVIEIVTALEDEFSTEIDECEIAALDTVQDLVNWLRDNVEL